MMKKSFFYSLVVLVMILLFNQCTESSNVTQMSETTTSINSDTTLYDEALANRLEADEYGMHSYVMAFLKAGPNRSQDSLEAATLQRAHLDNITRMAEAGTLVVAGPFLDDGVVRGIYIFDVKTIEEARALTATDPAIQTGRLEMELHPWYGPAALGLVKETSKKIAKKGI